MFIGHYAPAFFAATRAPHKKPILKLWQAFLAVQLLDFIFGILVLLGIEQMRVEPQAFTFIPYSHSLVFACFWACLSAMTFKTLTKQSYWSGAILFGILVISHWFTDLIMHEPDLTLWPGSEKFGWSLGHGSAVSPIIEIVFLLVSVFYLLAFSKIRAFKKSIFFILLVVSMITLQWVSHVTTVPATPFAFVMQMMGVLIFLILGAAFSEKSLFDVPVSREGPAP